MASYVSRLLGGKGTVLYVHGLAGSGPDVAGQAAWDAVIKSCPGMNAAPPPAAGAQAMAELALRMLNGQGVRPTLSSAGVPSFTDSDLSDWARLSWTLATPESGSRRPSVPALALSPRNAGEAGNAWQE